MSSIFTQIGIALKCITGIRDITAFKKNLKKNLGQIIYRKKYNANDLIDIMIGMGMKKGSVVCIHSAMKEFYNYKGTIKEFLDKVIEVITLEGTLMMPAYPNRDNIRNPEYIFNLKNDNTMAGAMAECFRNYPKVKRSANVRHSVCVYGKYADYLIRDHDKGVNCWDETSPWYKLCQLNGLVFNFGLGSSFVGTIDHCVEATLYKEHPYWAQFFNAENIYRYYDYNHNVHSYINRDCEIERRTREKNVIKYFDNKYFHTQTISNLYIMGYEAKPILEKMLVLGRKGICIYYVPSPKKYKF